MSSHDAMNPTERSAYGANGGACMRRVTEQPNPYVSFQVFVRHALLVSVKELWVNPVG